MKLSYGIDFGTTNSTIALVDEKNMLQKIEVDPGSPNPSVMRSIIYAGIDGSFLYGKPAIDAYLKDVAEGKGRTKKTMYTGRFITVAGDADIHGVRPDEVVEELIEFDEFEGGRMLQALKSVLANPAISSINIFGTVYSIEEVVAGFLREMKSRADTLIDQTIDSVVIGRPVKYVGADDRLALRRMKESAKLAGFKHITFEYEPIAAAYDFGSRSKQKQTVLIFDFGGGTLDLSVVEFPGKKVLANIGLPMGGDYFNSIIFTNKVQKFFGSETTYGPNKAFMPSYIYLSLRDWYAATLLKTEKFDEQMDHFRFMSSDEKAIDALRSLVNNNLSFSLYDEIDKTKRGLSKKEKNVLEFIAPRIEIKTELTRKEFEDLIREDVERIDALVNEALHKANVLSKEIDAVATTGGSSLIPIVKKLLEEKFGKGKIIESDAFTSVASGLALRAKEIFS
jgi:hypothetical chaperone protein